MQIYRFCDAAKVTIATSVVITNAIKYANYGGGTLIVPAGAGYTVITWYVSLDGQNFYPIDAGGGTNTTTTVAAGFAYPIPLTAFGAMYILPVATTGTAGTATMSLKG